MERFVPCVVSAATFAVVVLRLVERLFVLVESEVIDDDAVLALVSRFVARGPFDFSVKSDGSLPQQRRGHGQVTC